ncbi:hypothetical protein [Bauldia sp.]|uniref:hypothetical protein n=1 Tax=Bauldia sp. TaxID=2575872 RepID=UPI003BAB02B9
MLHRAMAAAAVLLFASVSAEAHLLGDCIPKEADAAYLVERGQKIVGVGIAPMTDGIDAAVFLAVNPDTGGWRLFYSRDGMRRAVRAA